MAESGSISKLAIAIFVIVLVVIVLITIGCALKKRRRGAKRRHGVEAGLKRTKRSAISRPQPYKAPTRKLPTGPRPTIPPRVSSAARAPVSKHSHAHLPTNPKVGPRPMLPPGAIVRQAQRPVPPMRGPPPNRPLPAPPQKAKLSLKTNFGPSMARSSPVSPMTRGDWANRRRSAVSPL